MRQLRREPQCRLPWLPEVQASSTDTHRICKAGHELQRRCDAMEEVGTGEGEDKHRYSNTVCCNKRVVLKLYTEADIDTCTISTYCDGIHRHADRRDRRYYCCYVHIIRRRPDERSDHVSAKHYHNSTVVVSKADPSRNYRARTDRPAAAHRHERHKEMENEKRRTTCIKR